MDSPLLKFDSPVRSDVGNNEDVCPEPFDPFDPHHLAFQSQKSEMVKKLKELQERSKKFLEFSTDFKKAEKVSKNELETSIREMKKDVSTVKNKLLEKVKNADGCRRSPKRRFSCFADDFGDLETSFDLLESSLHFDESLLDETLYESPVRRRSLSVGDLREGTLETIPFDVIQSECQKIIEYINEMKDDSFDFLSDEPAAMNSSNSSEDECGLPKDLPEVPKIVKKAEVTPECSKGPLKAFAPVPANASNNSPNTSDGHTSAQSKSSSSQPKEIVRSTRSSTLRANLVSSKLKFSRP